MRTRFSSVLALTLSLALIGAGCGGSTSGSVSTTGGAGGSPARGGGACDNAYFPTAQGTKLTYVTTFSGRTGGYTLEVLEKTATSLKLKYTFSVASAPSGSLSFTQDINCNDGALTASSYADMGSAMSGGRVSAQTTRASGEIMPRNLAVGTTWSSSFDITATISMPAPIGTRTVDSTINNESRVVGRESVTVPAGTYQAFKVESTLNTASGPVMGVTVPPQTVESTAWFVEGIGTVKTTSANSTTELQSVTRS